MTYLTEKNDIYSVNCGDGEQVDMTPKEIVEFVIGDFDGSLSLEQAENGAWEQVMTTCNGSHTQREDVAGATEDAAFDVWYAGLWENQEYLQFLSKADKVNWMLKD